jgi:hypothetical protein
MSIKENSFDVAGGGMVGSLNVQPSLGTHFTSDDRGRIPYYDPNVTGQVDTHVTDASGSFDKDVEQLFKQKEKPTTDDIICGIQYELQTMVHKDKRVAKERVIDNIKKFGPKYYSKLNMLNIDDKEMDTTDVFVERVKVLKDMIKEKEAKRSDFQLNDAIKNILQEKRENILNKSDELIKRCL